MNLSEFRAWFEGYTEEMSGPPNREQWKKIKAKVRKIEDRPTPYTVFIDRYRPYWFGPYWIGSSYSSSQGSLSISATNADDTPENWNSSDAYRQLGRIEAQTTG